MTPTRSYVTGTGAVAGAGHGVDELFANLCAGYTGASGADMPERATRCLLDAVHQAVGADGIGDDLCDVPVLVGTGLHELRSLEPRWRDGADFALDDMHFGRALHERFGAVAAYTFANACSASLYALALGMDLLHLGAADAVVVAGVDVLTESMHGDGAAAVVLRQRPPDGADAGGFGVLRAVAVNCDAFHVTAPDPAGIADAMRDAHRRADVKPSDIDLVLAHGTGMLLNDEAEALALSTVFGPHCDTPLVTAIRSMTGHTSGASGLLGVVVALESMRRGVVPPAVGLDDVVDEAAAVRFVRGTAVRRRVSVAQVNAFGFGGVNAVAIVEAPAPEAPR